jgi:hypothetical protein
MYKDNTMNYQKHYDILIDRSKIRQFGKNRKQLESEIGCIERHHIIPKCLSGTNKKENLVFLTPEEHYVAHQLLCRIFPQCYGLAIAVFRMTHNGKNLYRNNKLYGWIRKQVAIATGEIKKLPVMINGIKYQSLKYASLSLQADEGNLRQKCKSNDIRYIDYFYIDKISGLRTIPILSEYKEIKNKSYREISINGIIYNSINDAVISLNISKGLIRRRCISRYYEYKDWFYVNEGYNPEYIEKALKKKSNKSLVIDNVKYESATNAANVLGISISVVSRRCLSEKFPNWYYN